MDDKKLEKLNKLLELVQNDTVSPKDIEKFLVLVLDVIKKSKDNFESISAENLQTIASAIAHIEELTLNVENDLSSKSSTLLGQIEAKLALVNDTLTKVKKIKSTPGKDGYTPVKGVDYFDGENGNPGKDGSPDTAEEIRNKLETLEGEERLDAKYIKNLPILKNGKFYGGSGIKEIIAGSNITIDNTNLGYPVISSTGGSGTPGGSDTQLQYNNTGSFGGITGATTNGTAVTYSSGNLLVTDVKASSSAGVSVLNSSGGTVADFGTGGSTNSSIHGAINIGTDSADYIQFVGGTGSATENLVGSSTNIDKVIVPKGSGKFKVTGNANISGLTASQILATNASKDLISLDTATYPSLTELSYVKGVTSAIQTQIDGKQPLDSDLTTIAGLTATTDNIIQSSGSAWASRTPTQVTSTLINFVGDSGSGGTKGLVPAPAAGDAAASKFLKADGTWATASAGSGATVALDNLASVAINTSLISDTDVTDDLGSTTKKWNNIYGAHLGATGTRFTDGFFTDLAVTNAITGSITGNAATVTNGLYTTDVGSVVQAYDADLTTWAGITPGTGVGTALAVNVGTAGSFVVNGGALGTPSSGTVTNLTGTASININGTVGATTPTTGSFTTVSASTSATVATSDTSTTPRLAVTQGSTGDAAMIFGLATTRSYAVGIDNSASDSFIISTAASGSAVLGTGNLFTLTTAGALTLASGATLGGTLALGANSIAMSGSIGVTGTRVTKIWATDGEFTNAPTIGGTAATGTGGLVRATSPTLVTPVLGTPTSGTLTNCTGLPISTGVSGLGTGIATALAVNTGSAGAPVLFNGAGGTPSSLTLTNATGLPITTGLTGGNWKVIYTNGSGAAVELALGSSGQVLTSNGATSAPTFETPSGGGMTWTEVTGTSQSAAVDNGYIANNAALVTVTLPTTAAVGKVVRVVGKGAGGWKVAQNASEIIHIGGLDTTTGTGGSIASVIRYDSVELVCIVADTEWVAITPSVLTVV